MNDEEIMKKFNETFSDNSQELGMTQQEVVTPYRATTNQNVVTTNTVIPTASNNSIPPLNNNVPVNTVNINIANNPNSQVNTTDTTNNINNENNNNNNNVSGVVDNKSQPSNVNYNYVQTNEVKKKKTISIKLSPELISVIVIIVVLLVAMFIIPNIYDFFTRV